MKLSDAIESYMDARSDYQNLKDSKSLSEYDNQENRTILMENYEESKAVLDSFEIKGDHENNRRDRKNSFRECQRRS